MSPSDWHYKRFKHWPVWKIKDNMCVCDICGREWNQKSLREWQDEEWANIRNRWQDDRGRRRRDITHTCAYATA